MVCLNELAKLDASFARRHGIHLYKPRSLEERIDETRRYRRLILNNIDDFKRFLSEFNEIINENTNNSELRAFLKGQNVSYEAGSKGNKLLEKVYTGVMTDTENLIAPFFYLYDLRLCADHTGKDTTLTDVAKKLGIPDVTDYHAIMTALLKAMISSCTKLSAKI